MLLMLVNKKSWYSSKDQEVPKIQDVNKLPDSRISVLPRRPIVAAQEVESEI